MIFIITLFLLPGITTATLSDMQWQIQVGDRINYIYRGSLSPEEGIVLEEEIYFTVDDLTGIPVPTIAEPSVTPYWANGTPFDQEGEEGFFASNIEAIDSIAARTGNWTLYKDPIIEHWNSQSHDSLTFAVTIDESSAVWNVTVSAFWADLLGIFTLSYSKTDGILNYGYYGDYNGTEEERMWFLSITRIVPQYSLQVEIVIGALAIVVGVVVIIVVKRR